MDRLEYLVDQHVREFDLHLRHVDHLLASVRKASVDNGAPPATGELLRRIEAHRAALAQEFGHFRRAPPEDLEQALTLGQRLSSALESLGHELEKTLAAVLDQRGL
jgi:hypothetical protein